MISLIKDQFFVSLVKNAKSAAGHIPQKNITIKNLRRIQKLRHSKLQSADFNSLNDELNSQKFENLNLRKTLTKLNDTVDSVANTLKSQSDRKEVLNSLNSKLKVVAQLRGDLLILKNVAIDAHKHEDISDDHWKTISAYIIKLERAVILKERDLSSSLLL